MANCIILKILKQISKKGHGVSSSKEQKVIHDINIVSIVLMFVK